MIKTIRPLALVAVMAGFTGCSSTGGTFAVPEGNYATYDCNQLKSQISSIRFHIKELRELMARSGQGAGGTFVNLIAYRSEYDQALGRLKEAEAEAGRKGCGLQGPAASERSMY